MATLFADRRDGGRALAQALAHYHQHPEVLVLGLPRGGIATAAVVAQRLQLPLDVLMVRKLVSGGQVVGVIASGGHQLLNRGVLAELALPEAELQALIARERLALQQRERRYRGEAPLPTLARHVVVLVDDGMASGATMQVAVASARALRPRRLVVAVPVAAAASLAALTHVDEVVCLHAVAEFTRLADYYGDFTTLDDDQVIDLLAASGHRPLQDIDIPPYT